MATPVENPQGPEQGTGEPGSGAPVPEAPQAPGGAPVPHGEPPQPHGLPVPGPDGVITSGRGSRQDFPATPETPPAPETSPSSQGPGANPERQEVGDLPAWAQQIIKDARDDAAKARVNAKQTAADEARKQMAQDIGRALGIITDDTPPEEQLSPEQLQELLAGERVTARNARVELAVFKAAQGGGGFNASALLDSRAFLESIKDIDPNDSEALATKIAEAVSAQPWLAAPASPTTPDEGDEVPQVPVTPVASVAPVAPPSGGQFAGGPGAQPQDLSAMSIDDFRRLRRNNTTRP